MEPTDARNNNHERITTYLERDGVDVNQRYARKNTLLMIAASACSYETMEVLLRHGAKQDLQNNNGETALMIIAKGSEVVGRNSQTKRDVHLNPIKLLLEYGANLPDYKATLDLQGNTRRETALMLAARNGREDICKLLMNAGADTQLKSRQRDYRGKNAQDFLLKARPRCTLILQNRTFPTSEPTSPTSVASPILSEQQITSSVGAPNLSDQQNSQTEEDALNEIIESIDSMFTFKIVFTLLTYQYKTKNLSFDEYKEYVYKALYRTASECISVNRGEYSKFVLDCLKYARNNHLIDEYQELDLQAKAKNCEVHQRINNLQNQLDNLKNQINITKSCLEKMQKRYKDHARIKKGIAFAKVIVDIFTFGMGGGLTEVVMECGLGNVIDFGSFGDVLSGIISDDSESIISNDSEPSGLVDFIKDSVKSAVKSTVKSTEERLESAEERARNRLDKDICKTLDEFKSDSNNTKDDKEKLHNLCECLLQMKIKKYETNPNISHTGESEAEDPIAPSTLSVPTLALNETGEANPNAPHTGGIEAKGHISARLTQKETDEANFGEKNITTVKLRQRSHEGYNAKMTYADAVGNSGEKDKKEKYEVYETKGRKDKEVLRSAALQISDLDKPKRSYADILKSRSRSSPF